MGINFAGSIAFIALIIVRVEMDYVFTLSEPGVFNGFEQIRGVYVYGENGNAGIPRI